VTLGLDAAGNAIPTIGTTTRTMAGFPLNSFFLVPYTYNDANGDGLIAPTEVAIGAVNAAGSPIDTSYVGMGFAPTTMAVAAGIDLLRRQVRINASFDHRGGHAQLINTHSFLCGQSVSHEEVSNPDTELWRQARCSAARSGVTVPAPTAANPAATTIVRTNIGFYEKGDFWRFRELSLTYEAPQSLVKHLRYAESASLSLGARNLKVWTNYTGEDPEANYSTGDTPSTLLTTAPRRYYTARLNVTF
jgi:hypothetical protein